MALFSVSRARFLVMWLLFFHGPLAGQEHPTAHIGTFRFVLFFVKDEFCLKKYLNCANMAPSLLSITDHLDPMHAKSELALLPALNRPGPKPPGT